MTRMLMVTDVQDNIKRHQAQIITSLKDPDIRLSRLQFLYLSSAGFLLLMHMLIVIWHIDSLWNLVYPLL
uniref:Uncharacterized protein MANES_04G010400 n=1 Tax=Rhizophora mucronata TaxID=61149 RepID=A0A2P2MSV8_RHIMU